MPTTIAHLSDLKFGAIDAGVAKAVRADIASLRPDVVVLSGDLTRRASKEQFTQARRFLDELGTPHVVVPGGHDVERLNLINRFFRPLKGYHESITNDGAPFFSNAEVAVLGIDTSRAGRGRISVSQAGLIRTKLGSLEQVTVLVTHHPLLLRPAAGTVLANAPANKELHVISKCVDLVLAGHQAASGPQDARVAYRVLDKQTIIAQAGITIGAAGVRDTSPYYNAVRIGDDRVSIAVRLWRGSAFEEQGAKSYKFGQGRWEKFVDMPDDFTWNDSSSPKA
jgi:hypothetical protein